LEPEILVVDEVLAVGDAEFQKKCLGKIETVAREQGRTVLFVSHNMSAVAKLCNEAVLIDRGKLITKDVATQVVQGYLGVGAATSSCIDFSRRTIRSTNVRIKAGFISRDGHSPVGEFSFGENIHIRVKVGASEDTKFSLELLLRDDQGVPIAFSPGGLGFDSEYRLSRGEIRTIVCELCDLKLAEGTYSLDVMLANTGVGFYDYIESGLRFKIAPTAIANRNWTFRQSRGQGSLLLQSKQQLV
jgi:lipopolysaccharide transport system ATP-binding protein